MISPLSAPVLGTSAVVSTPAIWAVWRGALPFDVGLTRFLVVQLACWLALSAVAALLSPARTPSGPHPGPQPGPQPGPHPGPQPGPQPHGSGPRA